VSSATVLAGDDERDVAMDSHDPHERRVEAKAHAFACKLRLHDRRDIRIFLRQERACHIGRR